MSMTKATVSFDCPHCGASPGKPCTSTVLTHATKVPGFFYGRTLSYYHEARHNARRYGNTHEKGKS